MEFSLNREGLGGSMLFTVTDCERLMAMDRRITLALRYCVTAWLAILRWVLLLGLLVCFGMSDWTKSMNWLIAAGAVGVLFLVALIAFMIESVRVRCLMCGAGMLRPLRCSQHAAAKRWFGSAVVRSTLVLATFPKAMDCPYCGGHYKFTSDGKVRSRKDPEGKDRSRRASST